MNYIKNLLLLLLMNISSVSFAKSDSETNKTVEPDQMTFNFSMFYPMSLNKNNDIATNINISMLYGNVGSVSGVGLSGLVNCVKRDVVGFDIAGIANLVGTETTGFQSGGIINFLGSHFQGMQIAGVYNSVGGNASFFQTAGVSNKVKGNFTGFQTAGIVNILKGDLNGLQVSTLNIARNVNGVQIGVLNKSKKITGVQLGVINIADEIEGVPIGLINYSKKGKVHAIVWSSNIILTNIGVKFAVNDYFYSILSGGYNNLSKNVSKSLSVGYFMGLHFPIDRNLYLETDIGGYSVDNDKLFKSEEGIRNQNMLQARLIVGYNFFEKLSIFAGIGENYSVDSRQKFVDGKSETIFMAGLQLF